MGVGGKESFAVERSGIFLEKELSGAIAAGKAPQFEVFSFDFHKQRRVCNGKVVSYFQVTIAALLDKQVIEVIDGQTISRCEKIESTFDGRLGSVDLIERALRQILLKRWPQIGWHLKQVRIVGYSAIAIDYERGPRVQVTLGVVYRGNQTPRIVVREGVDTLGVAFDSLVTIYHLVAWRILRRLRVEMRKGSER